MSLGVVHNNNLLLLRQLLLAVEGIDNLVNGSSAGMCLKWVAENNENHNGQSSIGDEIRLRVCLKSSMLRSLSCTCTLCPLTHQDDISQYILSKAKIAKHSNHFIDKGSGANRRKDDLDDGSLTVILQFVMHGKDLA